MKRPFDTNEGLADLNKKILVGVYEPLPDKFSQDLKDLVAAMLIVNAKDRPGIRQILSHPLVIQHIRLIVESNEFKE